MKYIFLLLLVPLLTTPAFGAAPLLPEDYEQTIPSENGTLNIGLSVDPPAKANEVSKLHIGWINPGFNKIQQHIDYKITVIKDGQNIFRANSSYPYLCRNCKDSCRVYIKWRTPSENRDGRNFVPTNST